MTSSDSNQNQNTNQPEELRPVDTRAFQIREKLQQDIVSLITAKLEKGEMTEDRAKAIARMTLEKLPEGISYEDLMRTIPTLDDEFEELKVAIFPIIDEYQKKIASQVHAEISRLIKENKLEDALNLTDKTLIFESQLG
jgi:hypothetical protein